ncbi:MAG TPA: transposase, partial [Stenotrophomonas sp.]|nr:transposase [Stenotrophomonas sp.]
YLLACQRYIELNLVRAEMVAHPGDYRWSSYGAHAQGRVNALLVPHSAFELMAADVEERRRRYVAFIEQGIPAGDLASIRKALQSQRRLAGTLTGSDPFAGQRALTLGRCRGEWPVH